MAQNAFKTDERICERADPFALVVRFCLASLPELAKFRTLIAEAA